MLYQIGVIQMGRAIHRRIKSREEEKSNIDNKDRIENSFFIFLNNLKISFALHAANCKTFCFLPIPIFATGTGSMFLIPPVHKSSCF